jgi:hypothetical protein
MLGQNDFLYITWGTGVGGCVVISGNEYIPEIRVLNWNEVFKRIDALCGGGNAVNNFGVKLNFLKSKQLSLLEENFVNELKRICNFLNIRYVVVGGGVTEKMEDTVSRIKKDMVKMGVQLEKSTLGDFSAIYGGYALLQSKVGKDWFKGNKL